MTGAALQVLFLCTGNSARSILAEALLNALGAERFRAHSAGSKPRGEVHHLALEALQRAGLHGPGLRSKSWSEFEGPDAPRIDIVITVCDNAAAETCPVWPGAPVSAHWGLPDPAAVVGSDEHQRAAFEQTLRDLELRVRALLALPFDALDRTERRLALQRIGNAG